MIITSKIKIKIVRLYHKGFSDNQIARITHVSKTHIGRIRQQLNLKARRRPFHKRYNKKTLDKKKMG